MKLRIPIKWSILVLATLLLCICSTIWMSCKKTSESIELIQTTDASTITTLKLWVIGKKQSGNTIQQQGLDSLLRKVMWQESVQTGVSSEKSIIYVPIRNSTIGLAFFFDSKTKQVDSGNIVRIISMQDNIPNAQIMAVRTYYETVLLQHTPTTAFSGKIEAYSILNRFLYNYTYNNGTILSHGIVAPKPQENKVKSNGIGIKSNSSDCELWGLWIIYPDGSASLMFTWWDCSGGGGGGCLPPSLAITIERGNQYVRVNCAGDGGNGGGGAGGGPSYEEPLNVTNEIVTPCLKNLVDAILNSKLQNTVTDILKNIFSVSADVNLKFKESTTITNANGDPVSGQMSGVANNGLVDVSLYVNPDLLKDNSQEFRTAVIVHEMIHAKYFYANSLNNDSLFSGYFQHAGMLNDYVDKMRIAIQEFCPGMSINASVSLSLYGLGAQVANSTAFDEVITRFGMNKNPNSTDHWAYYMQQYQAKTLGTPCNY